MDLLDKKKSRKKVKKSASELNETSSVSAASSSGQKSKGEQDWLKEQDVELIRRIKEVLPDNDQRSYESRANKIIWENVCFGGKSAYECRSRWDFIMERQRHFRTLSEVTDDALKWTDYRWYSFYGGENQKPPDCPKQPLTSYNFFMNEKKEEIMLQNPHMTSKEISSIAGKMFRALNEKKKEKYVELARVARENYKKQLQEYNDTHTSVKLPGKMEPPQPPTPFKLFSANHATLASSAFKALNDEERLKWIDLALAQESNYLKKYEQFKVENPKLRPKLLPILNEEERLLVQRRYGKPTKPPTSGFKLFASEFPSVSSNKDRLTDWSASWRALSKKEKNVYKQRVIAMKHEYNTKLSSYLSKLPAERMHQEVVNLLPDTVGMKRKKPTESNASNSTKKAKFTLGNPLQTDPNESDSSSGTSSDDEPVEIDRTSSSSSKSGKKVASSVIERCTIQSEEDTSSDEEESSDSSEEESTESNNKKSSAMASSSSTLVRPIWASQQKLFKNEPPKPPKSAAEWHAFEIFKVSKISEKKKKDLWNGLSEKKRRKLEMEHTKRLEQYEEKLQAFKKGLSKTELLAFEHVKRSERSVSDDESD